MLRLRICPHCQEETYSQKAYFCHRCGVELPPPPDVEEITPPTVEMGHVPSLSKEGTKNRKLMIVAAVLCVALFSATTVYFYFQIRPSQTSLPSKPSSKNEVFVANVSFAVKNHPFSAKGLAEVVPADVDLYLESVDPELLLPALVSTEDWSTIESVLAEKVGLSPAEFASFLEDEFAVIQESTASAFLARARDIDFLEQKIAEVGEYAGWEARLVEGFLILSNSPDLAMSIEEAQKKLTLNLSLTSGFAEARKKLPQTGQIFYYGKKRLPFIPEGAKGEAFVVSKKDEGTLITGL